MKPLIFCILFSFFSFLNNSVAEGCTTPLSDSIKYKGYRLELTDFKMVKQKGDWIKLECDVVNSGRMNVDMGRKGTEHWVVFKFDQSLFDLKMGGYREHIKRQMAIDGFKLERGKVRENVLLKISTALPEPPVAQQKAPKEKTESEKATSNMTWETNVANETNNVEFIGKGGSSEIPAWEKGPIPIEEKTCPDILFTDLKIISQDGRHATVEYTIRNQGTGSFYLFGKNASEKDNLHINAYLSGVTVMTRGALPVGGEAVTGEIRKTNELKIGEEFTGQLKVDIRKKTRYMKGLVLNLESTQFAQECDRKNNDKGLVLE